MMWELEWGGEQQLELLLHSGIVGTMLGFLFDLMTGLWRGAPKSNRFIADVLFCLLASMVTFMSSLILTDGKLHPVLFVGMILGVVSEHMVVGVWISRVVYKCVATVRRTKSRIGRCVLRAMRKIGALLRAKRAKLMKREGNVKKR